MKIALVGFEERQWWLKELDKSNWHRLPPQYVTAAVKCLTYKDIAYKEKAFVKLCEYFNNRYNNQNCVDRKMIGIRVEYPSYMNMNIANAYDLLEYIETRIQYRKCVVIQCVKHAVDKI